MRGGTSSPRDDLPPGGRQRVSWCPPSDRTPVSNQRAAAIPPRPLGEVRKGGTPPPVDLSGRERIAAARYGRPSPAPLVSASGCPPPRGLGVPLLARASPAPPPSGEVRAGGVAPLPCKLVCSDQVVARRSLDRAAAGLAAEGGILGQG